MIKRVMIILLVLFLVVNSLYPTRVGVLEEIAKPEMIQVEVNSKFAPLAALLLEYIFREGWYDPSKRLPLLTVRSGEDTYAVSSASGPVAAECLSFPDRDGASMAATLAQCSYASLADIYHGRHAPYSNHRLGLAMDINDFNYAGVDLGSLDLH